MTSSVSVLIINYKYGRYLLDALASVQQQTHKPHEVVVADDGSADDSAELCRAFSGLDIGFVTGPHVGLARNISRGLEACSGDLIAFLSADDRWLAHHLEAGVSALQREQEAALSYSLVELIDELGERIEVPPSMKRPPHMPSGRIDPTVLLPAQLIPTQAAIVRRDALRSVGGLDTSLHFAELDLFIRLAARYPVVFTGQTTVQYRVHGSSLSHDYERALAARLALYEKHLPEQTTERRRLVARAYTKTAYRQLRYADERASLRAARRNVLMAARVFPPSILRPLNIAILLASLLGRAFPPLRAFYERRLLRGRLKLVLQRLLLMGR